MEDPETLRTNLLNSLAQIIVQKQSSLGGNNSSKAFLSLWHHSLMANKSSSVSTHVQSLQGTAPPPPPPPPHAPQAPTSVTWPTLIGPGIQRPPPQSYLIGASSAPSHSSEASLSLPPPTSWAVWLVGFLLQFYIVFTLYIQGRKNR
ncbi:hypothetical protein ACFX2C_004363 [Malus domestica]